MRLNPLVMALLLLTSMVPLSHWSSANAATTRYSSRCTDCGVITGIGKVKKTHGGSGVGLVLGAVAGGVIGHQFGDGNGQKAATAIGAAGGAYAGNEIEKNRHATTYYKVKVEMNDGDTRRLKVNSRQGLYVGQRVRVRGNNIVLR